MKTFSHLNSNQTIFLLIKNDQSLSIWTEMKPSICMTQRYYIHWFVCACFLKPWCQKAGLTRKTSKQETPALISSPHLP